jgi:hypothetical protein
MRRRLTTVLGVTVVLVLGVWLVPKLFFGWYGGAPVETSGERAPTDPALKTQVQSPAKAQSAPDEAPGVRQIEVTKAGQQQAKPEAKPILVEDQAVTTSKVGIERSELAAPDPNAKSDEKAFDPEAIGKFLQGLEQ